METRVYFYKLYDVAYYFFYNYHAYLRFCKCTQQNKNQQKTKQNKTKKKEKKRNRKKHSRQYDLDPRTAHCTKWKNKNKMISHR